jgi:hypothetical protein
MKAETYFDLKSAIIGKGYADEIDWQQNLQPCENNSQFSQEAVWVILNSGMKEQIARMISDRIYAALEQKRDISEVFGHKGKVAAIKYVIANSGDLFSGYVLAEDKLAFLRTIPFIGKITCYHLAKNLGHDCIKPDRHLVRIAKRYETTPEEMCEKLSKETGDRKCVVDIVIWRSANLGLC